MARRKRKNHGQNSDQLAEIQVHLRSLGLTSIDEYREWCSDSGFSACVRKTVMQKRTEMQFYRSKKALLRLKSHKKESNLRLQVSKIFSKQVKTEDLGSNNVLMSISQGMRASSRPGLLKKILLELESVSRLLEHVMYTKAVINIVEYSTYWLRPLIDWKPKTHNAEKQYASLLRHLFAKYSVPTFMDSAWLGNNRNAMKWYIHIGAGNNIRTADALPVNLSKKMAHYFMFAPQNYSIEGAFRWSQILSLGGNRRLADAVHGTRLVEDFRDDAFAMSVMRFFVENPMLDLRYVNPVVDYIWNQKYENRVIFVGRGVAHEVGPVQPNFSMHGRSVETLIRQVEQWHRQLGRERRNANLQWLRSGIKGFSHTEGRKDTDDRFSWRISELLNGQELALEGRSQHHCVATYARSCFKGVTSIWSMDCIVKSERIKTVTIEVHNQSRTIRQIRGKYNRMVKDNEFAVIRRWAATENLQIASYAG